MTPKDKFRPGDIGLFTNIKETLKTAEREIVNNK